MELTSEMCRTLKYINQEMDRSGLRQSKTNHQFVQAMTAYAISLADINDSCPQGTWGGREWQQKKVEELLTNIEDSEWFVATRDCIESDFSLIGIFRGKFYFL